MYNVYYIHEKSKGERETESPQSFSGAKCSSMYLSVSCRSAVNVPSGFLSVVICVVLALQSDMF